MDDLKNLEEEIDTALLRAGGANYDLGNSRSGVKGGNSDALKAEVPKKMLPSPRSWRLLCVCRKQIDASAHIFGEKVLALLLDHS